MGLGAKLPRSMCNLQLYSVFFDCNLCAPVEAISSHQCELVAACDQYCPSLGDAPTHSCAAAMCVMCPAGVKSPPSASARRRARDRAQHEHHQQVELPGEAGLLPDPADANGNNDLADGVQEAVTAGNSMRLMFADVLSTDAAAAAAGTQPASVLPHKHREL